jgi:hypothetical protein
MLKTVEAIYDSKQGLAFKEAVNVTEPVKVLVTFVERDKVRRPNRLCRAVRGATVANDAPNGSILIARLIALNSNRLPNSAKLSDAEIDAQIRELAENFRSRLLKLTFNTYKVAKFAR